MSEKDTKNLGVESIVLCRCGHERDKHGSRYEQRDGEKVVLLRRILG